MRTWSGLRGFRGKARGQTKMDLGGVFNSHPYNDGASFVCPCRSVPAGPYTSPCLTLWSTTSRSQRKTEIRHLPAQAHPDPDFCPDKRMIATWPKVGCPAPPGERVPTLIPKGSKARGQKARGQKARGQTKMDLGGVFNSHPYNDGASFVCPCRSCPCRSCPCRSPAGPCRSVPAGPMPGS